MTPDQAIEEVQALAIEQLVTELPEEFGALAAWLDARIARQFRQLEEKMTQVSDEVAAVQQAVQGAAQRVTAEINDLEGKLADPNTTASPADLQGLRDAVASLGQIGVAPPAPADPGTGTTTPTTGGTDGGTTPAAPTDVPVPVDGGTTDGGTPAGQ